MSGAGSHRAIEIAEEVAGADPVERAIDALRREWRNGCNGRALEEGAVPATKELFDRARSTEVKAEIGRILYRYDQYRTLDREQRRRELPELAKALEALKPHIPGAAAGTPANGVADQTLPDPDGERKRARQPRTISSIDPDAPVSALPTVAKAREALLKSKLGIETVGDLVTYAPRAYIDYSRTIRIGEAIGLRPGELVTIKGTLLKVDLHRGGKSTRVEARLDDGSGWIRLVWFNSYLGRQIGAGDEIVVSGEIEAGYGRPSLTNPEWEWANRAGLSTGGMVPIYRLTQGLTQKVMRNLTRMALDATRATLVDFLPPGLLREKRMPALHEALETVHYPRSQARLDRARERLAFGEMLLLQIGLTRRRRARQATGAYPFQFDGADIGRFEETLPFRFTGAQRRVVNEIAGDLRLSHPMARLLQGDVGSGKTAVAATAAWLAFKNGLQTAVLAPTEILAEQHAASLSQLFAALPEEDRPTVQLLTGSTRAKARRELLADLIEGEINLLVGTHAVIEANVAFKNLGLTIIDEQHRFGVRQRESLPGKGREIEPHVLSMTATPIPRTLNAVVNGDLDVSIIDELPPGRIPVETRLFLGKERHKAYELIRAEVASGRQVFVICPLVEESELIDARAAVAEAERLRQDVFPDLRIEVLHGRMKGREKDAIMTRFRDREADILVSTSVIEVGIDVPNASVILIEGADRFGLAQLHQLRGRVGRGREQSYCLLLSDEPSIAGQTRLRLMTETNDGFVLAGEDLKLRGPGDFLGTRQSGLPATPWLAEGFDSRLLDEARQAAEAILTTDAELQRLDHRALAARFDAFWKDHAGTQAA